MNILYVGPLPPHPGGSAIVGAQLLPGFAQLGHAVRALAPITPEALQRGDRFAGRHPSVAITRFIVPFFETAPNDPPPDEYRRLEHEQVCRLLHRLIAAERPDVILIGRETFAFHVPDVAAAHDVPTLVQVHGGTSAGMDDGSFPAAMRERLLGQLARVDRLILVATHLTELYRRWGFRDACVIQNGVDLDHFTPGSRNPTLARQLAIDHDDLVVMHVSNLKGLKRPLDIVSSAERALQELPQLRYVIVGDGPFRQAVEDACKERGIVERFRFAGWIEHEHIPEYLRLADMVVIPSQSEALALIYLETMACGRLLLASDIAGAREVVADGVNGMLFRRGDVGDLTAKTLAAATDAPLRARIGRRARELVAAHALARTTDAYVSVMAEVVRDHELGTPRCRRTSDLAERSS